jgi:hypothetical protein
MTSTSAELLAAAEQSPRAAAAHDRAAWVGLFAADGRIEDPVGSKPHIGHPNIGRFYDTFIAPRQITFDRDLDVVRGESVVRDLTLEVVMSSGLIMHIPAYLRYDLRESEGRWEITVLRAYWELPAMVAQMLRRGAKAVPTSLQLTSALLRHQGLRGTTGFLSGFRGAGKREKRLVESFLAAASAGDAVPAMGALSRDTNLIEQLRGARWSKLIAAGDTVVASVTTSAGRGVMFFDIPSAAGGISEIRYYTG